MQRTPAICRIFTVGMLLLLIHVTPGIAESNLAFYDGFNYAGKADLAEEWTLTGLVSMGNGEIILDNDGSAGAHAQHVITGVEAFEFKALGKWIGRSYGGLSTYMGFGSEGVTEELVAWWADGFYDEWTAVTPSGRFETNCCYTDQLNVWRLLEVHRNGTQIDFMADGEIIMSRVEPALDGLELTFIQLTGGWISTTAWDYVEVTSLDHETLEIIPPSDQVLECVDGGAEFFLDAIPLDSSTFDWNFSWSSDSIAFTNHTENHTSAWAPLGNHSWSLHVSDGTLTADHTGNVTIIDTRPPTDETVVLTEPAVTPWVHGARLLRSATDVCGSAVPMTRLGNGTPLAHDFVDVSDGSWKIQTWATDEIGLKSPPTMMQFHVDSTDPVVAINNHNEPWLAVGKQIVRITASDSTSGVDRVEIYVDGEFRFADDEPPFRWTWRSGRETLGHHVLEARAIDASGNTASDVRIVTVASKNPYLYLL